MTVNEVSPELLQGKHIFILEDNLENRVVYQMTLGKYRPIVTFDRSGQDLLFQMGKLSRIDLIILDLMLPQGVSGFDIYDEIRSVPRYANVPVIAVSAMESALAIPKAQAKGLHGFITKPIDKYGFPKQLAMILSGQQVWYAGEREMP